LEALTEYENLSKQFYPGITIITSDSDERRISIVSLDKSIPSVPAPPSGMPMKAFTDHLKIMEKLIRVLKSEYIDPGSISEVSLSASIRDSIIAFIDNGNYNPLIFENARDSVYETVQTLQNNFIRKAYQDKLNAGIIFFLLRLDV
jgi:hypothetical protein